MVKEGPILSRYGSVQLILEQIVNGMLPVDISPNIAYQYFLAMLGLKVILQDLPSINFIRSCQTIFQITCETLVDYCIGEVKQWYQLFSDSMGKS